MPALQERVSICTRAERQLRPEHALVLLDVVAVVSIDTRAERQLRLVEVVHALAEVVREYQSEQEPKGN